MNQIVELHINAKVSFARITYDWKNNSTLARSELVGIQNDLGS